MQPVSLRRIREEYRRTLSVIHDGREADALFYWTAEEILRKERRQLTECLDEPLDDTAARLFESVLSRLRQGEPVQYVFGKAYFLDLELEVDPSVLIPRGETEELALWAEDTLRLVPRPVILDLCTGSGAIAVALAKKRPESEVFACDISLPALRTASRNNAKCGTDVRFFRQDILEEPLPGSVGNRSFDLVVSNPPYVRPSEKALMHDNVLRHEPHPALFVPEDDPLRFYRFVARIAMDVLRTGGCVMAEINEAFPGECKALFEQTGFADVSVREDLHGRPRMLRGFKIASKNVSSRDYSAQER